jgi:predicted nucleic acid-binding protein
MTFLLDTSALLAHYRDEAGSDRVQSLFDDPDGRILITSISLTEFARRMVSLGCSELEVEQILADYRFLFHGMISVDEKVALKAFRIGGLCSERIPLVDSLIAAAASLNEATLVHRDEHFESIPSIILESEKLGVA